MHANFASVSMLIDETHKFLVNHMQICSSVLCFVLKTRKTRANHREQTECQIEARPTLPVSGTQVNEGVQAASVYQEEKPKRSHRQLCLDFLRLSYASMCATKMLSLLLHE